MPRSSILSATERASLLALPGSQDDLIRFYTFDESDLALIRQRRGDANRIGFYAICALAELKNALRSSDIWAQDSRQFKDFEEYLLPADKFGALMQANELPVAVSADCDQYLHDRLTLLEQQLTVVKRLAVAKELPGAIITESGLRITRSTRRCRRPVRRRTCRRYHASVPCAVAGC